MNFTVVVLHLFTLAIVILLVQISINKSLRLAGINPAPMKSCILLSAEQQTHFKGNCRVLQRSIRAERHTSQD